VLFKAPASRFFHSSRNRARILLEYIQIQLLLNCCNDCQHEILPGNSAPGPRARIHIQADKLCGPRRTTQLKYHNSPATLATFISNNSHLVTSFTYYNPHLSFITLTIAATFIYYYNPQLCTTFTYYCTTTPQLSLITTAQLSVIATPEFSLLQPHNFHLLQPHNQSFTYYNPQLSSWEEIVILLDWMPKKFT
jgi:hypothetical protein